MICTIKEHPCSITRLSRQTDWCSPPRSHRHWLQSNPKVNNQFVKAQLWRIKSVSRPRHNLCTGWDMSWQYEWFTIVIVHLL